ncbi:transcription intermediary factor 1-beta-like [Mizuhopecten yessoensis]|uniref:Transcription intermediary factor 1-beta n=1 Tax=Mizuhopecten yessoensis TaxID=6573 RepID=A0A210R206_MIZYE|nr:transcription intermediary factor 1-beta-like [Mizuhopecten yessoensis]OWF55078.1 Transcription intermediary factor 1-beta [Mizuhopecten yessoensis]
MADEVINGNEHVSICFLCQDDFRDPRLLECYHTFCFKCIKTYLDINSRGGMYKCPLCKVEMKVPLLGAMGLEKNHYTESKNSDLRAGTNCDICQQRTPKMTHCYQCEQNMCESCVAYHARVESTKDHNTGEITEPDRPRDRHIVRCFIHNAEMQYYCEECKELICLDCNMTSHKLHPCKEVGEAAVSYRTELAEELKKDEYKSHLKELSKGNKEVQIDKEKAIALLDKQKTDIQKHLEIIRLEVMQQFIDDEDQVSKSPKGDEDEETKDDKFKSFADIYFLTSQMLDQADDTVIVEHGAKLLDSLRTMKTSGENSKAMRRKNMSFQPGTLNKELLRRMFGKITFTEK